MVKYSFELKLKIVEDYLSGQGGYKFLSEKYHLKNRQQIVNWVASYKKYGATGLRRKHQKKFMIVCLSLMR